MPKYDTVQELIRSISKQVRIHNYRSISSRFLLSHSHWTSRDLDERLDLGEGSGVKGEFVLTKYGKTQSQPQVQPCEPRTSSRQSFPVRYPQPDLEGAELGDRLYHCWRAGCRLVQALSGG